MVRSIALAVCLAALGAPAARAAEPFEGIWAQTARECRDKDGANSRTFIDLSNRENGRAVPLFDQYEHHCRIGKITRAGAATKLALTCFEFWDDWRANKNARRESATLRPVDAKTLKIDGRRYVRCRD